VPADSLSASQLPASRERLGVDQFFLAKFSSFGAEADAMAPGVGIIATVPEQFGLTAPYAVMDGTSMASPIVCGTLAVLLASSPTYHTLTGAARAEEARAILRKHCVSAGLPAKFQGHGVPRVP
jgi:subtilisin family serine protease